MTPEFVGLTAIVCGAYLIGAATGFGGSVLVVTLAVHLFPIDVLIPLVVPLNLVLSTYLAVRHRRSIDRRALTRRILPYVGVGLPLGWLVFQVVSADELKWAFGVFVVALAVFEIGRTLRTRDVAVTGRVPGGGLWLLVGGFVHGLWVSGGPPIVYWASRVLKDKHSFRATLVAMWSLLNSALFVGHVVGGRIDVQTLTMSAQVFPALVVGAFFGERLHGRLPERNFRLLVFAVLGVAGAAIVLRSLIEPGA